MTSTSRLKGDTTTRQSGATPKVHLTSRKNLITLPCIIALNLLEILSTINTIRVTKSEETTLDKVGRNGVRKLRGEIVVCIIGDEFADAD